MANQTRQVADICIIGSGIASTSTLIALFELLLSKQKTCNKPLRITVTERYHEMWKGIPYGNRSSVNALTITTINDFYTADEEREKFFKWFLINKDDQLRNYLHLGGSTAQQWMADNKKALDKKDWNNIYLPRFIIGNYIIERFNVLRSKVEDEGLAIVETIQSDVTSLKQLNSEKSFEVFSDNRFIAAAKKIVLAIGSAPEQKLTTVFDNRSEVLYINNLHAKNLEDTADEIRSKLSSVAKSERNVLIIGSNASSIELLYLLYNTRDLISNIESITIMSLGGKLPGHITYNRYNHNITANLDTLVLDGNYDIEKLVKAATRDILNVVANKVSVPDVDHIMALTIKLLEPLDVDSKKLFYALYGVQLARVFRRSGTDYKKASDKLVENKKLRILKGSFTGLIYNKDSTTTLLYKSADDKAEELTQNFTVIVNCTGAEDLQNSPSALIKDLIQNNGLKVNPSRKAFEVNHNLEAAPGIYVIGPLAGGNFNELVYFWHLENASRIIYLSKYLAKELLS